MQGQKVNVIGIIIFAFSISCIAYAGYIYFHDSAIFHNYEKPLIINKYGIYPVIDDSEKHYDVAINFTTSLFAVQNRINVSIIAWPDETYENSFPDDSHQRQYFIIYFLSSSTDYDIYKQGAKIPPDLKIIKHSDGLYYGNYTIWYEEEGDKCIRISFQTAKSLPYTCLYNETGAFHISSADSTLQYQNNRITLILTFVILGFTILTIDYKLRGYFIIENYINKIKDKKQTKIDDKKFEQ